MPTDLETHISRSKSRGQWTTEVKVGALGDMCEGSD